VTPAGPPTVPAHTDGAKGSDDPGSRLARAVAPQPTLMIAEHPSAGLPREAVPRVAEHVAQMARARDAALLTLTADPEWVSRIGGDVLTLSPATGELASGGGFMERFRRVFGG